MKDPNAKTGSSESEEIDNPLTVWERLFGFLTTWDLTTNVLIWLVLVTGALILGLVLAILSFLIL